MKSAQCFWGCEMAKRFAASSKHMTRDSDQRWIPCVPQYIYIEKWSKRHCHRSFHCQATRNIVALIPLCCACVHVGAWMLCVVRWREVFRLCLCLFNNMYAAQCTAMKKYAGARVMKISIENVTELLDCEESDNGAHELHEFAKLHAQALAERIYGWFPDAFGMYEFVSANSRFCCCFTFGGWVKLNSFFRKSYDNFWLSSQFDYNNNLPLQAGFHTGQVLQLTKSTKPKIP